MFVDFFFELKHAGIPVTPTSFLTLQKALNMGLVMSLDDFYTSSRAILVKSERYFDLFDRVFAHHFKDSEIPETESATLSRMARELLEQWLENGRTVSEILGVDEKALAKLTPEELIAYFLARLEEQRGQHHGGNKWIGTGGTSPVGHSGYHPDGMRIGGFSRNKSAVKVAMDRRYKDYSHRGTLTRPMIGEALKRLRHMIPDGPRDQVNIRRTIDQTLKNAGEIEIVFDRRLKDRLKVILAIDNGGFSMDPYVPVVQTLFDYAKDQFKEIKTFFFHNTIYDSLWQDATRYRKPVKVEDFSRYDPQARFVAVGDASMAPYELMARDGSIHIEERSGIPSIERLRFLSETFKHRVWLNPVPVTMWRHVRTISLIGEMFPMFELTLDGLESAVSRLMVS
jgi:hypothetical protein